MADDNQHYDLFLSHDSRDKGQDHHERGWVRSVYDSLKVREVGKHALSVFLDEAVIKPGDGITPKLAAGLRSSAGLVVFVSENTINNLTRKKSWVYLELEFFIGKMTNTANCALYFLADSDEGQSQREDELRQQFFKQFDERWEASDTKPKTNHPFGRDIDVKDILWVGRWRQEELLREVRKDPKLDSYRSVCGDFTFELEAGGRNGSPTCGPSRPGLGVVEYLVNRHSQRELFRAGQRERSQMFAAFGLAGHVISRFTDHLAAHPQEPRSLDIPPLESWEPDEVERELISQVGRGPRLLYQYVCQKETLRKMMQPRFGEYLRLLKKSLGRNPQASVIFFLEYREPGLLAKLATWFNPSAQSTLSQRDVESWLNGPGAECIRIDGFEKINLEHLPRWCGAYQLKQIESQARKILEEPLTMEIWVERIGDILKPHFFGDAK
ncbi:MAG: toll/interleukin-1 receptor domain-containing protein [Vulcanimicrobiota bacterium]